MPLGPASTMRVSFCFTASSPIVFPFLIFLRCPILGIARCVFSSCQPANRNLFPPSCRLIYSLPRHSSESWNDEVSLHRHDGSTMSKRLTRKNVKQCQANARRNKKIGWGIPESARISSRLGSIGGGIKRVWVVLDGSRVVGSGSKWDWKYPKPEFMKAGV